MSQEINEVLHRLSECYDSVGNAIRLKILEVLIDQRCFVKELAEKLDRSVQSISNHLRILSKDDLVESETQGQRRFYWVKKPELVRELLHMRRFFERME